MASTASFPTDLPDFATTVTQWQSECGRHHLPWQQSDDPYRVWLSEIMLQQTQVTTVIAYYERFLARFPTLQSLASATQEEVMPYWAGLGYYARARNLHRCAQTIFEQWGAEFPQRAAQLMTLPGIGRSTAAAIAAFVYGERSPIMDGNVRRIFTRYFGIEGNTAHKAVEQQLWSKAEEVLQAAPATLNMAAYTQGLMDLGATVCTRAKPNCTSCPLSQSCYARQHQRQSELPTPKPRKAQRERHCLMLILQANDQVLLQQRPSSGIWGGLLSLPQFETHSEMALSCENQGFSLNQAKKMAETSHAFTHFKLHIQPWWLVGTNNLLREPQPGLIWVPLESLGAAALPAPVRGLLAGLYDGI